MWTVGWLMLWTVFAPLAFWAGFWVMDGAFRTFLATVALLLVASPFSAVAATTFGMVSALPIGIAIYAAIALFIGLVALIYHWETVSYLVDAMFAG